MSHETCQELLKLKKKKKKIDPTKLRNRAQTSKVAKDEWGGGGGGGEEERKLARRGGYTFHFTSLHGC